MSVIYKETNVFEEAIKRMNMIFDYNDEVIVSMSGGKDSTVCFNLALMVARERNRLPLKVFWLDQEAEWQHTVDYMDKIMRMPEVEPLWFQIPFYFPNNLSTANGKESLLIWDPEQKDKWVHPQSDISIKECPFDFDVNQSRDKAFYTLMNRLPDCCLKEDTQACAVISGMRTDESLNRRTAIMFGKPTFRGETWARSRITKKSKCQVFWPIYDFLSDDVWTAIAKNNWDYNKCYDLMYRWGVKKNNMRVSALIHETSWVAIQMLQEFEKDTYNRFCARINGVSTFNHAFDEGGVLPKSLPFMFKDWKEYRDYLLIHLVEPKYWDHYKNEWKGQDGDEWYQVHACEVVLNDTCGTLNGNFASKIATVKKIKNGNYMNKALDEYKEFLKGESNGN